MKRNAPSNAAGEETDDVPESQSQEPQDMNTPKTHKRRISRPSVNEQGFTNSYRGVEFMLLSEKCITNRHLRRLTGGGVRGGPDCRSLYENTFNCTELDDHSTPENPTSFSLEPWAHQFMQLLVYDKRFAQIACKSRKLGKDLVDSVAIVERVEKLLSGDKQESSIDNNQPDNLIPKQTKFSYHKDAFETGQDLLFFDMCSGKGITTIMLAMRFPQAKVIGIDVRPANPSEIHLQDGLLPNLTRITGDAYDAALIRKTVHQNTPQSENTGSCILLGTHLCGDLSRLCIDMMMETESTISTQSSGNEPDKEGSLEAHQPSFVFPQISAAIVAPCCLSRQKKPKLLASRPNQGWGYDTTEQARKRGMPAFDLWLDRLFQRAPVPPAYKQRYTDVDMLSTKNTFIILQRPPADESHLFCQEAVVKE